jgi:hypothetical protein
MKVPSAHISPERQSRRGPILLALVLLCLSRSTTVGAASVEPADQSSPRDCREEANEGTSGNTLSVTEIELPTIKSPLLVNRGDQISSHEWELPIEAGSIGQGEKNFFVKASLKSDPNGESLNRYISGSASFDPPSSILLTVCVDPVVNGTKLSAGKYRAVLKLFDNRLPKDKVPFDVWVGGDQKNSFYVIAGALGLFAALLFVAAFSYELIRLPRIKSKLPKATVLTVRIGLCVLLMLMWVVCILLYRERDEFHLWSLEKVSNLESFLAFAYSLVASAVTAVGLGLGVILRVPGVRKGPQQSDDAREV